MRKICLLLKSTDGWKENYLFSKGLLKIGMWKFFEVLKKYRRREMYSQNFIQYNWSLHKGFTDRLELLFFTVD